MKPYLEGYVITQDDPDGRLVLGWRKSIGDTRSPTMPLEVLPNTYCSVSGFEKTFDEFRAMEHKGSLFIAMTDGKEQTTQIHTFPDWASMTPSEKERAAK